MLHVLGLFVDVILRTTCFDGNHENGSKVFFIRFSLA